MNHAGFRPLTLNDRDWIERCRDSAEHPFTALTFPSLLTWASTYGLTIAGDDNFFVIRSLHDKGYFAPCGDPVKCEAFMELAAQKEACARFLFLTEAQVRHFEKLGWSTLFRGDLSEYILSTYALALIPGHVISHSYRDKCRHLEKSYDFEVHEITPGDLPRLEEIVDLAERENPASHGDLDVARFEIQHFQALSMRGILLTAPEGAAFALGYESGPGIFTMTMSKHDPTLPESITALLIHHFAILLKDLYPRINIEEDLGLEGLRTAKQLYSPVDLLKVYEVLK